MSRAESDRIIRIEPSSLESSSNKMMSRCLFCEMTNCAVVRFTFDLEGFVLAADLALADLVGAVCLFGFEELHFIR